MDICHQHNLVNPAKGGADQPYGIRVTLPQEDSLNRLLGADWEKFHWYATESERDRAFNDMAKRHGYYRVSDSPSQILEKVTR